MTAPKEEATAAPSEIAEGEDPPAVNAQHEAVTPQKESNLPEDAPKEVCMYSIDAHNAMHVQY